MKLKTFGCTTSGYGEIASSTYLHQKSRGTVFFLNVPMGRMPLSLHHLNLKCEPKWIQKLLACSSEDQVLRLRNLKVKPTFVHRYTVNIRVEEKRPFRQRTYTLCWSFPFKCSKYTIKIKTIYRTEVRLFTMNLSI